MIWMDVPQILQKPELPNGCEITSCCEVLRFLGYPADKCDLADHDLPRSEYWYGADPDLVYMGDPHRDDDDPHTGYYCFARPVVEAANRYMARMNAAGRESTTNRESTINRESTTNRQSTTVRENADGRENAAARESGMQAVDITGADQAQLEDHLRAGRPFIFWASLHFDDIQFDPAGGYDLPDGRHHRVFHQLHCMVCRGMDEKYFYIADPLDYNEKVDKRQFMKIYRQLGSRAVVFMPADLPWRKLAAHLQETGRSGMKAQPGFLPCGPRNDITDVPGVKAGHWTCMNDRHHTGVTVILPREDVFTHKCAAAAHVFNGYGKSAGLVQIQELGQLESPIALTNTLNVGLVSDALVEYTIREQAALGRQVRSFNPVVGECNDASLNTITERIIAYPQVAEAIARAKAGMTFSQGCIGAGAGMTCHGLKGGIGSASRLVRIDGRTYTVGVLSLCNHGELRELVLPGMPDAGVRIEEALRAREKTYRPKPDQGSCIMVLATDLPLSSRQLGRAARRCGAGLARCGSFFGHGSGDIAIAFTTAYDLAGTGEAVVSYPVLKEDMLDQVFAAAAEATQESVLNALSCARTVRRADGTVRYALREMLEEMEYEGF